MCPVITIVQPNGCRAGTGRALGLLAMVVATEALHGRRCQPILFAATPATVMPSGAILRRCASGITRLAALTVHTDEMNCDPADLPAMSAAAAQASLWSILAEALVALGVFHLGDAPACRRRCQHPATDS
jgi:hypothetical protein